MAITTTRRTWEDAFGAHLQIIVKDGDTVLETWGIPDEEQDNEAYITAREEEYLALWQS